MPAAQPPIDDLERAFTQLQAELAAIKTENESLKQQISAGVLTDAQAATVQKLTEAVLGKSSGPSGQPSSRPS